MISAHHQQFNPINFFRKLNNWLMENATVPSRVDGFESSFFVLLSVKLPLLVFSAKKSAGSIFRKLFSQAYSNVEPWWLMMVLMRHHKPASIFHSSALEWLSAFALLPWNNSLHHHDVCVWFLLQLSVMHRPRPASASAKKHRNLFLLLLPNYVTTDELVSFSTFANKMRP